MKMLKHSILGLSVLSVALLVACNKDNVNEVLENNTEQSMVTVNLPLTINQGSVNVIESGRIESTTLNPNEMDIFVISVESSADNGHTYSKYANAAFTNVPNSIELALSEGFTYRIRSFLYNNNIDSVIDNTLNDYSGYYPDAPLNQMNYQPDAEAFFLGRIFQKSAHYHRTFWGTSERTTSRTKFPFIDHYFSEHLFQIDTGSIQSLTFEKHNARLVFDIKNVSDNSRIQIRLPGFTSALIQRDTTFSMDIKTVAPGYYSNGNDMDTEIFHDHFLDSVNVQQALYTNTIELKRLETILFQITAPTIDDSGATNSGIVIVEEDFVEGDTIQIGG